MIDETDQRLKDWVGETLGKVNIFLAAPGQTEKKEGIGLYLMEIAKTPLARGMKNPPLKLMLRYLVTAWFQEPMKAHQMLGQLMIQAMENLEIEVELEPLSASLWKAFGIAPRPSFILRVPFLHKRPEKLLPAVRTPLSMKGTPLRSLFGQVVFGPKDQGIMGARVELPAVHLSTKTDAKGRFRFPAVPSDPPVDLVRVNVKGCEISVPTQKAVTQDEPFIIRLKEKEILKGREE